MPVSHAGLLDVGGRPLYEGPPLTASSGTYNATSAACKYLRVRIQAPGAGGSDGGGGAGEYLDVIVPYTGPVAWVIGAPGAGGTKGTSGGANAGNVVFGHLTVFGGRGGRRDVTTSSGENGFGGGYVEGPEVLAVRQGGIFVPGGAGGGYSNGGRVVTNGRAAGLPWLMYAGSAATGGGVASSGSGGGASMLGPGGNGATTAGGAGSTPSGYGGGGGGGGSNAGTLGAAGAPGIIYVQELAW